MQKELFDYFMYGWIGLAILIFPIQFFVTAPYGRHFSNKWGKGMSNRWGWVVMESVSLFVLSFFFFNTTKEHSSMAWFAYLLWAIHYINRSFVFPFRTKTKGKKIPISIVSSAIFFNVVNAGTNGYFLGYLENYSNDWFTDPRFIIGILLFFMGAAINISADNALIKLRKASNEGYQIPRGGLFSYISCPNHFGEMLEWVGFAIMCWNLPALGFAVWTIANLLPRAFSHHTWYKAHFDNYPLERKAAIPWLI